VGKPVDLEELDVFCDGTAVRRAGEVTFSLCRQLVDEFLTVTNEEVCAALQFLWEKRRVITEPAGAMGLAGWLKHREVHADHRRILIVLCGANMDFAQLSRVVQGARIGSAKRRYLQFAIEERAGTLLQLLRDLRTEASIVEFQYGKTHEEEAHPVIGFDALEETHTAMVDRWEKAGVVVEDVTDAPDVRFRAIPLRPDLAAFPLFVEVEFPERAGALMQFLESAPLEASIIYFNYQYSGERVGRALIGFDFPNEDALEKFAQLCLEEESGLRRTQRLSRERMARLCASPGSQQNG
ncbi:MAG: pyridoxal-phosphate dependent enzyme, partial [Verrucomicrobiota bacterium]